eukprot:gene3799-7550_t
MSLFSSLGQSANDIWSITGISFASPVNDILDKENFSIEELLREDELLQEVKSRNGRLIEFLTQEEVMDKLINFIITSVDPSEGDLRTFKYPYMSCEVLCCEIPDILHILVEDCDGKYLRKLFSILDTSNPLDHYLAGYFEKTLEMLFRRMTIPVMTYLNQGGSNLLQKFLNHINNYSIMQVVQRLLLPHIPFSIGTVDLESVPLEDRQNCQCNWSFLEDTCGLLCNKMLEEGGTDVPSHVSDLLITVLQLSPPDAQFISHLCEPSCLDKLFAAAFAEDSETQELSLQLPPPAANISLAAISVLESLVSRLCETMNPFDAMGVEMQPDQLQQAESQVQQNVDRVCVALLPAVVHAKKQLEVHLVTGDTNGRQTAPCGQLESQAGGSFRRLGHRGLQLVKLVEAVLKMGRVDVDEALCEHGLIQMCVELMFQFELNSLLHFAVQRITVMALEGGPSRRSCHRVLIQDCSLLRRIIDTVVLADSNTPASKAALANCRRPVIGHLVQIAQVIVAALESESLEKSDQELASDGKITETSSGKETLSSLIEQHANPPMAVWDDFVNDTLRRILEIQSCNPPVQESPSLRSPSFLMENVPRTSGLQGSALDMDDEDDDDDFGPSLGLMEHDLDLGELENTLQSMSVHGSMFHEVDNSFGRLPRAPSASGYRASGSSAILNDDEEEDEDDVDDGMAVANFDEMGEDQIRNNNATAAYLYSFQSQSRSNEQFQTDFDFAQFDSAASGDGTSSSMSFEQMTFPSDDGGGGGGPSAFDVQDPFFTADSSKSFEDLFSDVGSSKSEQDSANDANQTMIDSSAAADDDASPKEEVLLEDTDDSTRTGK